MSALRESNLKCACRKMSNITEFCFHRPSSADFVPLTDLSNGCPVFKSIRFFSLTLQKHLKTIECFYIPAKGRQHMRINKSCERGMMLP